MNVNEIESILKKGVPTRKTSEARQDLKMLSNFFKARTGRNIPCNWCERALLFRHCTTLIQRIRANQLQNHSSILQ